MSLKTPACGPPSKSWILDTFGGEEKEVIINKPDFEGGR